MTWTAETDDEAGVGVGCRIRPCDEVVGLQDGVADLAATVSNTPENAAAVSDYDDSADKRLDFFFYERSLRCASCPEWRVAF